jgi:hypothetical protein
LFHWRKFTNLVTLLRTKHYLLLDKAHADYKIQTEGEG